MSSYQVVPMAPAGPPGPPGPPGAPGAVLAVASTRLLLDVSTTSVPPVYSALMSAALLTTTGTALSIVFTATVRHTGAAINVAMNFRFRLNGILIAPGGGTTVNAPRDQIQPVAYSSRVPIVAGLQTVAVEWAGFGLGVNTMRIDAAALPDLNHAQLRLLETV